MYIKKICENHEYCNIEMPSPNNNIIKLPFILYNYHLLCTLIWNIY